MGFEHGAQPTVLDLFWEISVKTESTKNQSNIEEKKNLKSKNSVKSGG